MTASIFTIATSPTAIVRERALDHNVELLARWCERRGVMLAPHGKTTMTPEIFRRQLAAGAWGITVADVPQARIALAHGVARVLIANEVVDRVGLDWIVRTHADGPAVIALFVDSATGADALASAVRAAGVDTRVPVLVEVGRSGGRAGVRSTDRVVELARRLADSGAASLVGVAGFEGVFGPSAAGGDLGGVRSFLMDLRNAARALDAAGMFDPGAEEILLSAGGSAYFDLVVELLRDAVPRGRVLLRCGCYVTHDHGVYGELTPFAQRERRHGALQPALEVWGHVLSKPEAGLAIADVGRRHVSIDAGLPRLIEVRDGSGTPRELPSAVEVSGLNDQHAFLAGAGADALQVGDWVGFGISHPCTTFDKWRRIALVDDAYGVVDDLATQFP
jgi:D-serine deaminase-like pyridoxal phosphate-dependent protein